MQLKEAGTMRTTAKTRFLPLLLGMALALYAAPVAAAPQAQSSDLAAGIRQVEDGDLDAAVETLKDAAKRLSLDPARAKDAARAFLYLGVAYAGLEREDEARAQFRDAFTHDPALQVAAGTFSARVIRLLQEEHDRAFPPKKGNVLSPVLLTTAGVGGAAAIAAGSKDNGGSSDASVAPNIRSFNITPGDFAIAGVTEVTFDLSVTCLPSGYTYTVDFGDGTPLYSGAVPARTSLVDTCSTTVRRTYSRTGDFRVTISLSAGGPTATAMAIVHVRSLNGTWFFDPFSPEQGVNYLTQNGTSFTGYCQPCCSWRRDLRGEIRGTLEYKGSDDSCVSLRWEQNSTTAMTEWFCPPFDRICLPSPLGFCLDRGE